MLSDEGEQWKPKNVIIMISIYIYTHIGSIYKLDINAEKATNLCDWEN